MTQTIQPPNWHALKIQLHECFQSKEDCRAMMMWIEFQIAEMELKRANTNFKRFWNYIYVRGLTHRAKKVKIEQRAGKMYISYLVEDVWVMDSVR